MGKTFRSARHRQLSALFPSAATIVDFGGEARFWKESGCAADITLLNIAAQTPINGYKFLKADGRQTHLPSKSFELAFSNSAIEHVGGWDEQRRFADEMLRVGKSVYCQTPNRWFPIEPHFLTPFIHWLPVKLRPWWLYRYFTVWGWLATNNDRESICAYRHDIHLLTKAEMRELFPGAEIIEERVLGFCKSLIAVKKDH